MVNRCSCYKFNTDFASFFIDAGKDKGPPKRTPATITPSVPDDDDDFQPPIPMPVRRTRPSSRPRPGPSTRTQPGPSTRPQPSSSSRPVITVSAPQAEVIVPLPPPARRATAEELNAAFRPHLLHPLSTVQPVADPPVVNEPIIRMPPYVDVSNVRRPEVQQPILRMPTYTAPAFAGKSITISLIH